MVSPYSSVFAQYSCGGGGNRRGDRRPLTLEAIKTKETCKREREGERERGREKRNIDRAGPLSQAVRRAGGLRNHWPTGDAVNETGPIGTRKKTKKREMDKKRVVWAAQKRVDDDDEDCTQCTRSGPTAQRRRTEA